MVGSSTIALDEGEYVLWIDLASNLDRTSTADDIITVPLTVGPGEDGAQITDTDGTITSTDYAFSADVSPGESIITFNNDSANEFHHVILVDFGTNDPALVESSMLEFLQSEEDAPPPEGIDMSQVNFEFAFSGVLGRAGRARSPRRFRRARPTLRCASSRTGRAGPHTPSSTKCSRSSSSDFASLSGFS